MVEVDQGRMVGEQMSEDSEKARSALAGAQMRKWGGWCEIVSDPAIFNCILRRVGLEGVRVSEVFSLDEEIIGSIPRPLYALIFLSRYVEPNEEKQEPKGGVENLWFANQTAQNCCATVALLNVVNNIPKDHFVDLGEHLKSFRAFTSNFTPALKGDALVNFEYLKDIHNSFARTMDMLEADLVLADKARKRKKYKSVEEENAFHFTAIMPIEGKLWKLDGLDEHPTDLGKIETENWIQQAREVIQDWMMAAEDQEFSLLAVAHTPELSLTRSLAENIARTLALVDAAKLQGVEPHGVYEICEKAAISVGYTMQSLAARFPQEEDPKLGSLSTVELNERLLRLNEERDSLVFKTNAERRLFLEDEEKANDLCVDYGPAIKEWVLALWEAGALENLLVEPVRS